MRDDSLFKICHSCQEEIPLSEKRCPYCEQRQQAPFEIRLNRWIRALFPNRYPASIILLAAMIIYFVVMAIDILTQSGMGLREAFLTPPVQTAYRWGAHRQGEFVWWRLITANFIHFGIIHIVFNAMALRYVAPYVERTFGSALTFANFILLGTLSMACSNFFSATSAVSAGASGALMGFIGLAAVAAHREHSVLSIQVRNSMIKWAVITMIFGVVGNVSGAMGIDNLAHASGLILGALAGFVLPAQSTVGFTKLWAIRMSRWLAFAAVLAAVSAFAMMGMSSASLRYQQECEANMHLKNFEVAEIACANAYRADKSRVVSYRNYIVISIIRGKNERAAALCVEGHRRFANRNEQTEFDQLCASVGVLNP